MFLSKGLRLAAVIVLILAVVTAGYSQNTQLRYVKTTDYGATWSAPTQAGDVSATYATTLTLPDFSAVAMNNDELCYAVFLPGAATPGVYAFAGPGFSPVLVLAEGDNNFGGVGSGSSGWANIGKTPNGDLFVVIWGADNTGSNTLWGAKSTNNAVSWTSFVIGAEPTLPTGSQSFQISDMNSATYCFVQFEDENYEQYVLRFPTSGGAGTFVDLNDDDALSGGVSYYIGQCKPIVYDPAASALFACHRATDNSAVQVHYSGDMGLTFSTQSIPSAQRYPSMALRAADQTPFVISNVGVPPAGNIHWAWYSYDQFGYNGGGWTEPDTMAQIVAENGSGGPLLYLNQAYFWNAMQGIGSHNNWGANTPDGLYSSRTTDGGLTWIDFSERWYWESMTYDPGSCSQNEIVGASNGIGYIIWCARVGAPDLDGHEYSNIQLLTPATQLPPYVMSAYVVDPSGNLDPTDNHVTFWCNMIAAGDDDTTDSDSSANLDPLNNGTYYFHIPASIHGTPIAQGDTIWYYFWGRDLAGNSGQSLTAAIIAGVQWLEVDNPVPATPGKFALHANYPNPFNPETQITFDIAAPSDVTLTVFNTLGQVVRVLADHRPMNVGTYSLTFNGADLPSGIYLYRLQAGDFFQTRQMILMK